MKKYNPKSSGLIGALVLTLITAFIATAQKLPGVQEKGLRAPAKVKIDGDAAEWGQFMAYNNSTEIFYSIANDDDNLYLIIRAVKKNIAKKIIMGGINFTINSSGKKDDIAAATIGFPVLNRKEASTITQYLDKKPDILPDTALMNRNADTLMRKANLQAGNSLKLIGVLGIKDITDSLISVYNDNDIHAAARFGVNMAFTYELAVPLKYLGLNLTHKFSYHIKLNGLNATDQHHILTGTGSISMGTDGTVLHSTFIPLNQDLVAATDLWGEYTLVKK